MAAKRKSLAFFSLAIALGLVAAFMAQRWAQQNVVSAQADAARGLTTVVVAAKAIEFGKRIEEDSVKAVDWPSDAQPEGVFNDVNMVVGMVSKYHILPGEPISMARVVDPDKSPLLSGLIAANKRAVSVRVDDVVGVAGFLLPGSRVDVLASKRLDASNRTYKTQTVLHNLKVLAVDQTSSAGNGEKPVVVRAVTLEVAPAEAEVLVQATREGSVQLVLRNPEDKSVPEVAVVKPKPKPKAVSRSTRTNQVMVIRGTQVDSQKTRR